MRTAPRLLDCTLRDGSYVVDFQFTAEDTAIIAAGLESAGVDLIEIGHGLGLHASAAGKGRAAASDDAYLRAAAESLQRAHWGTFFIPGIGRREDLDAAARAGMHFVRIGVDAPEVNACERFVAHARERGLFVFVNLMKSYAVPSAQLVELAARAESFGAQAVALVDSAGTMLPQEVAQYVSAMRAALAVPVGFHGHDNLSLAVANVLAAVEAGATYVDTTLQGIGRSGGNAITEIVVAILQKQGISTGIDLNRLMDLSDRVVRPLLRGKGRDALDITAGYAGFHSSYLHLILDYARRFKVDPRDLMVAVSGVDRVDVTESLVADVAASVATRHAGRSGLHIIDMPPSADAAAGAQGPTLAEAAAHVAQAARAVAAKTARLSVFNLVAATRPRPSSVSRFVQEEFEYVIGSAEIGDAADLPAFIDAADGVVDVWFVDADLSPVVRVSLAREAQRLVRKSRLVTYRDRDVWARAVEQQACAVLGTKSDATVVVYGVDPMALRLAVGLAERGFTPVLTGAASQALAAAAATVATMSAGPAPPIEPDAPAAAALADLVVSFETRGIGRDVIDAVAASTLVLDAAIGALQPEAFARAGERGIVVLRPDMRAVLAAELASVLGTERIARELMGRTDLDGVPIVAGGVVGRAGDIVVDSIRNPTRVIGVADGYGMLRSGHDRDTEARIATVERTIWRRKLGAETHPA